MTKARIRMCRIEWIWQCVQNSCYRESSLLNQDVFFRIPPYVDRVDIILRFHRVALFLRLWFQCLTIGCIKFFEICKVD